MYTEFLKVKYAELKYCLENDKPFLAGLIKSCIDRTLAKLPEQKPIQLKLFTDEKSN